MRLNRKNYICVLFFILMAGISYSQTDPLPSWNEGKVKQGIIDFINNITDKTNLDYIPEEDRIATFDNDGTLWPEQPVVQGMFMIAQVKKMVAANSSLKENPTIKAILEQDKEYFKDDAEKKIMELLVITHTEITEDEFDKDVKDFYALAVYPKLNKPVTECAYKPQVELLEYLRANGFKTYICSGGTVEFMRQVTPQMYGIPSEQVIGSYFKYKFIDTAGRGYIMREHELASINDKEGKPANIQLFIGKRPVFVSGNVRSGGDIAMMRFSQGSKYISHQILINHDDAEREFQYEEKGRFSLNAAEKYGFNVVSMKNDWKRIFQYEILK